MRWFQITGRLTDTDYYGPNHKYSFCFYETIRGDLIQSLSKCHNLRNFHHEIGFVYCWQRIRRAVERKKNVLLVVGGKRMGWLFWKFIRQGLHLSKLIHFGDCNFWFLSTKGKMARRKGEYQEKHFCWWRYWCAGDFYCNRWERFTRARKCAWASGVYNSVRICLWVGYYDSKKRLA